ncbi:hypothetical protein [Paraburkholderia sp. J12]|uniref:hypothetical protein n=1 Tax=Paraburkholderia sp. J12 TaxID=2805432 RepID=UPI002ABD37AC|nr:hypothetical protein [Paraburkholderia sp. J12]
MPKKQKFDLVMKFLLALAIGVFVVSNAARAESVNGKFFTGQEYSGEYSISESSNSDGMRVNPVTIRLTINGEKNPLLYTYVADDLPTIRANDMGFLSIITNSGGMEGSVTYDYVIIINGILVSIGTVQTTLHLGKIENIDAQPNKNLTRTKINYLIRQIVKFNPPALSESLNPYSAATLLLLGQGKFLTPEDDLILSVVYRNKEIIDDPVLLQALKKVIDPGDKDAETSAISSKKTVISNRAHFFSAPISSAVDTAYLIKGDAVSLVKKSADGRYWLADYVSSHGRRTEKWLRCEDIDYCR